jgi:uncharacterized protein YjbJ (UPF0337 family)
MRTNAAGAPAVAPARLGVIHDERTAHMNRDQIKGRAKEAAGTVQQKAGKLMGNPTQQVKGLVKRGIGKMQKTVGDAAERNRKDDGSC